MPEPLVLSWRLNFARRQMSPTADDAAPIDLAGVQPVLYAVRVNRQEYGVAPLLRSPEGRLLARRADLEEWRLRFPDVNATLARGEEHYPLDAFENVAYGVNESRQELISKFAAIFCPHGHR